MSRGLGDVYKRQDQAYVDPETNVTAPSEVQTEEAKNWVDNGSKL